MIKTRDGKIELGPEAGAKLKIDLLRAMGFDLGAIHAATGDAAERICEDLGARKPGWLHAASKAAATMVEQDYDEWSRAA